MPTKRSQAPTAPANADRTDKTSTGSDTPMLCAKMALRRRESDILFVFLRAGMPCHGDG